MNKLKSNNYSESSSSVPQSALGCELPALLLVCLGDTEGFEGFVPLAFKLGGGGGGALACCRFGVPLSPMAAAAAAILAWFCDKVLTDETVRKGVCD